jgi:hypothetical protein
MKMFLSIEKGIGFVLGSHMVVFSPLWSPFEIETHAHVEWIFFGPFRYLRFF